MEDREIMIRDDNIIAALIFLFCIYHGVADSFVEGLFSIERVPVSVENSFLIANWTGKRIRPSVIDQYDNFIRLNGGCCHFFLLF